MQRLRPKEEEQMPIKDNEFEPAVDGTKSIVFENLNQIETYIRGTQRYIEHLE